MMSQNEGHYPPAVQNFRQAIDNTVAEMRVLRADHEKMKEALETIASMPFTMSWQQHLYHAIELARKTIEELET